MKKKILTAAVVMTMVVAFTGCGKSSDPGTPPAEVVQGNNNSNQNTESDQKSNPVSGSYDGSVMENAVTIMVGRDGGTSFDVNMYNNAAVDTMLGYLSDSDLLFPTYTYEEEAGFSAQSIRGSYTRDDETEISDIHAGELYLFSDGQLRLYFKDVAGADITATPVGYLANPEGIEASVTGAYTENQGDTWGVDVYYHIKKN
ncbi:MAG: cyclophilin-like fold protein [bacterium]|nr:cyclophilin-like fold protein [bacterium]